MLREGTPAPRPQGDAPANALPATEQALAAAGDLDLLPLPQLLQRLHDANASSAQAVAAALPQVERVVDLLVAGWRRGGRLVMVGAGTSGRIAAAEAAECPPTFGTAPERVVAVLAGGERALREAVEGAEDDAAAGGGAMDGLAVGPADLVLGVSASGTAPFVVAAVRRAAERRAPTAGLTAVATSPLAVAAGIPLVLATGPEAVAGSTRMKAGTAQKMALNLLTTAAMIRLGHVYGNRMVDFQPTNAKLRARAVRTVAEVAHVAPAAAEAALETCAWRVKPAIVCAALRVGAPEAERLLAAAEGDLRRVWRGRAAVARGDLEGRDRTVWG